MAAATGMEPLEVSLTVLYRYDHRNTKAKSLINYQPKGDLATMVKSALMVKNEGYQDYTWEGV